MKKSFILLPALMMVLTACGGTTSDGTTTTTEPGTTTTTTEPGTTTTDPVEENNVKVAYEAAAALANKKESADAYDFDGVVIAKCGNSFFVYKDGYSMYVYSSSAHEGVEVGKTVAVNAKVKKYNGIIETGTVNSVTVTGDGVVPTATTITSAAELGALKQNVLVNYVGAIPADAGDYSAGNSPLVSTVVGEDTITTKFDKAGYNDDNGAAYLASKGHKANFTNVIATAFSTSGDTATNQLLFVGTSTLALVEVPATAVTLTADKEEATVGETVTLTPTVTPVDSTDEVTYEVTSGADLVTLSGNSLVAKAEGTVTVVAKAGTVTSDPVTITITASADPVVSFAVTGPTTKKVGATLTAEELTVTLTKQSGATEVTDVFTTDVELPYTFTAEDAIAGTKVISVTYAELSAQTVSIAVVDAVYKLDASVKGTNNSYAGNGDVAVNDVTWNVAGNATTNPWRIGGKSITNTDRAIYSKTAIAAANEIDINGLTDSGSITVNSMKVTVHSTADDAATGANAVAEFTPTYAKGSIVLTKADAGSWENCFYRIVFNVTVSVTSNKYVSFTDIQFYNL